jgi:rfaE bifunctional protein nucleotidyltransferase chain/domain
MSRNPADKVMSLEQAVAWRHELRRQGRRLAATNGCFDLLHRGHASYLNEARSCGDALLVAINSDASVRALKGPTRPLVTEQDRAYLLAALECVDAVVIFDSPRATELFRQLPPDVYVKGGDYTEETLDRDEYAVLKAAGAEFRFIRFINGLSTTNLVKKIQQDPC